MAKRITLSQACEGMLFYKTAVGKSPHTIADYRISFKKLQAFIKRVLPFLTCDNSRWG
jgi:hypothetical protein